MYIMRVLKIVTCLKLILLRDAMRKHGLCCRPVSVCFSARLSRWWIVSTWLKISSNFFGPVAPSLRFFGCMRRYPIPRGGEAKYTGPGWEKFAIFD